MVMRRKMMMMTSLVSLILTLVVFVSYYMYPSRDFFFSSDEEALTLALNSTVPQPLREASNHALAELPDPRRRRRRPRPTEAVLLPDWEALVLLPSGGSGGEVSCLFSNGAASPARLAGSIPSSGSAAYRCVLPRGVRRLRPFLSPRLVVPGAGAGAGAGEETSPEMLRWNRLAYESLSTPDDVVVFAKGVVNTRSAAAAAGVRCVYYSVRGSSSVAAISAAQEVFRCPHPPPSLEIGAELRVSLATGATNATPVPSLANYRPPRVPAAHDSPASLICACTMVYNAGKFLGEWVAYHAAIGVERFFLYDNASDDDDELSSAIRRLSSDGHHVSPRYWPWPKTQEAAFSHCAAVHRDACRWMAFIDVDEFVFSPDWAASARPNRSMLASLIPARPNNIGQVHLGSYEFGPSGLKAHPKAGVTQGYTCRRRAAERHKSLVRLDAVDRSLANSVHHFSLKDGFRTKRVRSVRVNHYKYQVWDEFKVKFRRRASAFVVDWSTAVNPGSKDRTPGLGFEAVEPIGWAKMFCEVTDFQLRDLARRWFGTARPGPGEHIKWCGNKDLRKIRY